MKKGIILLAAMICVVANFATAQQVVPSLTGTDFWMSFLPNMVATSERSLMIASEEDCMVYIEKGNHSWSTTVSIEANVMKRVVVPDDRISPTTYEHLHNCSWHIAASAPVIVYASNFANASHDMSAILPTATLRSDYITQTYTNSIDCQEISVVAPQANTSVQIILAEAIYDYEGNVSHAAGDTLNVTLARGGVYLLRSWNTHSYYNTDIQAGLSGARIHSSKPVAVFQGHSCANIPSGFHACDHIYEECIPTNYWGQNFVVMPTTDRRAIGNGNCIGDIVKVTALYDDCTINISGQPITTLAGGESYTFIVTNHSPDTSASMPPTEYFDLYQSDALPINTSSPATVCFYISGLSFGGSPGDPASVIIPPLEQSISHTIATAYNTPLSEAHHINIVASNADAPLVTLNGQNIASSFTATAEGYSWARLTIDTGTHVIDADTGRFLATFYGLGSAESYAYIAGMAVRSADYNVHADRHAMCPGDTVTITAKLNGAGLGTHWIVDGQPLGDNIDTLSLAFDDAGRHQVTIVITSVGDTVLEIFTVHPTFSSFSEDTLCSGDSLQWHGQTITASGWYVDSLHTVNGCDSSETLSIYIINAPRPSFDLTTDCEHYHYSILGTFEGDTAGYALSWQSSPPDASLEGQPWDSLSLSPSQTTVYNLHIDGMCSFDTTFILHPILWPVAAMEVRPEQLSLEKNSFEAIDQSLYANGRRWWVDGVPAGEEPILRHTANLFADSVLLTLVAFNESCADTLRHTLPISHTAVWVPNIFTPNQETNNRFGIVINEGVAEELFIYNRNGLLVAHIVGADPQWDGTHEGTPCPQGGYVWHLSYRRNDKPDELHTLTGTITLLR